MTGPSFDRRLVDWLGETSHLLPPARSGFDKVARRTLLVVRRGAGGVGESGFFGGKEFLEQVLVDRLHERLVRRDKPALKQSPDRIVHELHALTFPTYNDVLQLLGCAFANDR